MLALACLALAGGCARPDPGADAIRVGMAHLPITLDPRYATDAASQRVQEFLHRGLVRLDERFMPVGDLAESWSHPDALHYRFRLRADARFHDGSRVSADDVVATLASVMDAAHASPLRAGLAAVKAVRALNAREVEVELTRPDASLLTRLSLGVLPARQAQKGQIRSLDNGCGAYRLVFWKGGRLRIAPVNGKGPALEFVEVRDPVTRVLKLVRGELDFTQNDLPPHLYGWLRRQENLALATRPSTTFSYIGLNLQDARLKDVRVRRALALALDRERLKRALLGDLPVLAETVLVPDHWAAARLAPTPFDPEQAERLLDAAGFPRHADGVRFQLTYRTSTDPTRLRLATAIAAMWERIGVRTRIESLEWGGFYARIKRGDFQVFSLSWVGITDPDIYRWILHSSMWPPAGANRGRFRDPEVDAWLDAAAASEDPARRKALYAKVQRRMHEQMVYIPLWYEPVVAVSGPRIRGFRPAADGSLLGLSRVRFQSDGVPPR